MKTINNSNTVYRLMLLSVILSTVLCLSPSYAVISPGISKYYTVDVVLFSIHPERVWESYKWYGSCSGGGNASLGLACNDEFRSFSARTEIRMKDQRFFAKVSIKPYGQDKITKSDSFEVELTNLKPQSFKLAENEDGRVYMLNISPWIEIVDNTPKRADDTAFNFDRLSFGRSMVIVNDELYVGKMGVSGGPLAFVDISGIGRFEFAIKPFRNARLLGTLKDGKINIQCEDGTMVDIYSVKNGVHEIQLPGGPYEVWVRRQKPTETEDYAIPDEDEWIQQVKLHFAEIDASPPSDEELRQKYKIWKSKKHHITLASGVGPIKAEDRIE